MNGLFVIDDGILGSLIGEKVLVEGVSVVGVENFLWVVIVV